MLLSQPFVVWFNRNLDENEANFPANIGQNSKIKKCGTLVAIALIIKLYLYVIHVNNSFFFVESTHLRADIEILQALKYAYWNSAGYKI